MENPAEERIHNAKVGFMIAISIFLLFATWDVVSLILYGMESWASIVNAAILIALVIYSASVMKTRTPSVARSYASVMTCLFGLEVCCTLFAIIVLFAAQDEYETDIPTGYIIGAALGALVCVGGACALAAYSGKSLERALLSID